MALADKIAEARREKADAAARAAAEAMLRAKVEAVRYMERRSPIRLEPWQRDALSKHARASEAYELHMAGIPAYEIAHMLGIEERAVKHILAIYKTKNR